MASAALELRPLPAFAGADQRDDLLALGEHPGDRRRGDADAARMGCFAQSLDQREIVVEIVAGKARREGAEIGGMRARLRPMAGDEAARQHAVGGDADAERAAGRQDFTFDHAHDERIFDLQVGDRVNRRGAADGRCADLGEPDRPHIAGLDHIGDRADRILDRNVGVEPRRPIDVDHVDAEALQRIGEEILRSLRPRVIADETRGRIAQRAELDAQHITLARPALERFADEQLIVT